MFSIRKVGVMGQKDNLCLDGKRTWNPKIFQTSLDYILKLCFPVAANLDYESGHGI